MLEIIIIFVIIVIIKPLIGHLGYCMRRYVDSKFPVDDKKERKRGLRNLEPEQD